MYSSHKQVICNILWDLFMSFMIRLTILLLTDIIYIEEILVLSSHELGQTLQK